MDKTAASYDGLDDREHAERRFGMYGGQLKPQNLTRWIFDGEKYAQKNLVLSEGFETIVNEIFMNALDQQKTDPKMKYIKVWLREKSICVENDGQGIPLDEKTYHKGTKEELWAPTMVFGRFKSGENLKEGENDKRKGAGLNGIGAKIANLCCKKFTVTVQHPKSRKYFQQTWSNNMKDEGPVIRRGMNKDDQKGGFVRVEFEPDFKKFEMESIDGDVMLLLRSRVYDMAGFVKPTVQVYLDDELVPVKTFKDFADCFLGDEETTPRAFAQIKDSEVKGLARLDIAIGPSDEGFKCFALVNGLRTHDGTHVKHIVQDKIGKVVIDDLKKKNKQAKYQPAMFREQITVIMRLNIDNPEFNSQRKSTLTSKVSDWGFKVDFPASFIKKIESEEMGITDSIVQFNDLKQKRAIQRKIGPKTSGRVNIEKLDDALNARKPATSNCTLALTEGDSAKTLAVAGRTDKHNLGIYPLRGKLENMRDKKPGDVKRSDVVLKLMEIIGLQYGKKYTEEADLKTLRYKRIWVLTDADVDGYHICGLIMNLFHALWPSLLKLKPDFIQLFITPIVKMYPKGSTGAAQRNATQYFSTLPMFRKWCDSNDISKYDVEYLKGLASSTSADAKVYFDHLDDNLITLLYTGQESDDIIDLVFNKKRSDDRKTWLNDNYDPDLTIDFETKKVVEWPEFFNKQFIHFSTYDTQRSLPNAIDGFKPSQRKALYGIIKKNFVKPVRLSRVAAEVVGVSAYHHGEVSLIGTIANMAQRHHGTNNINLFHPNGAFGTREYKRDVYGAPRYISTYLEPITRLLFRPEDDVVLEYEEDEGKKIEPVVYMPIIPTALINGSSGIGTGWSVDVAAYNVREICDEVLKILDDYESFRKKYENGKFRVEEEDLVPWYDMFKGTIENSGDGKYKVSGKSEFIGSDLHITDLPPGTWRSQFMGDIKKKNFVGCEKGKSIDVFVKDEFDLSGDVSIDITLKCDPGQLEKIEKSTKNVYSRIGLEKSISTNNMWLFGIDKKLRKFDSAKEIIDYFCYHRIDTYAKRKQAIVKKLEFQSVELRNKRRYLEIVGGFNGNEKYEVHGKTLAQIHQELENMGFDKLALKINYQDEEFGGKEGYEYLGKMSQWATSIDKINRLRKECDDKLEELEKIRSTSLVQMWKNDIEEFLLGYEDFLKNKYEEVLLDENDENGSRKRKSEKKLPPSKRAKRTPKKRAPKKIKTEQN